MWGAGVFVVGFVTLEMEKQEPDNKMFDLVQRWGGTIILAGGLMNLIAMPLAVLGFFTKDRRQGFGVAGLILSILTVLGFCFLALLMRPFQA